MATEHRGAQRHYRRAKAHPGMWCPSSIVTAKETSLPITDLSLHAIRSREPKLSVNDGRLRLNLRYDFDRAP